MRYDEAKKLGTEWTKGHDVSLDGWRSVIAVLLTRINELEAENEALAIDLGIKNNDFKLPPQPQLQTIADIIREVEGKPL